MSNFVHLHVHTDYSLLDGLNKVMKLLEKAKTLNMPSVAITDHGVLYAIPEFWKNAHDFGVKPIIGCEIYLSPKEHSLRQEVDGIRYYHLILLAKNLIGYKNLIKMVTIGHLDGMYYKPRIDFETLKKHSEGLICSSACLAGPISRHILRDEPAIAEDWLQKIHSVFKDDFYIEIQRNGLRANDTIEQKVLDKLLPDEIQMQTETFSSLAKVNKKLYDFSEKYHIPMIATTDAHYLNEDDKEAQKVLFAIKDGTTLNNPNARNGYVEAYIKAVEEMEEAYSDMPQLLEETLKINEKIEEFSIKSDRVQPKYWNLPANTTAKDELHKQAFEGATERYGEMTSELKERIEYELMVIDKMGYNDYFLVVGDLMQFARKQGIVIGVRGSAAGCVVSYCLGITNIDPIKWELYFERFLNLERASPPDIDMDIQDDRRGEVIDYAREKYGERNVSAIITFGKMMTKAAIRDVARVMGLDLSLADKLAKKVTVLFGKPFPFDKMIETDPEFKQMVDENPDLQRLGEIVKKIEGLNRHAGVHAAGYLITPEPIDEYMAFQRDANEPDVYVTQMDGTFIDKLDFMKFDFLGLRTLTIIKNSLDYIKERHGEEIELRDVPDNDTKTFELFSKGETVGVFQFESPPMQQYLKELRPEDQEEICFLAAAYRPGPMKYIPDYIKCKHGQKEAEYLIPELEPVLKKTFGFPIYQEQLYKICMEFGGFTLGEGDVIRNALKKKRLDILQSKEPGFLKYFIEHYPQYGEEKGKEIWAQLKPFSDYGFNKAHSASYAVVAYWCAYLKAHYPLEFVTSLMHSDLGNTDRVVIDIKEAKRLGYKILPPDVNCSDVHFKPENDSGIRFGLGAIKNVGAKLCESIVSERNRNGLYKNLDDLVQRVGTKNINKRAIECLIKVGALEEFGDRNALLAVVPEVFEKAEKDLKAEEIGQTGFFLNNSNEEDSISTIEATRFPSFTPATEKERMNWERDLIGIFVTVHPLSKFEWTAIYPNVISADEVEFMSQGTPVRIVGMLTNIKYTFTKKDNSKMAICRIEDMNGICDAVMFPRTFTELEKKGFVEEARAFMITGIVNLRDERRSVIIEDISIAGEMLRPKKIKMDIRKIKDKEVIEEIKNCFDDEGELEIEVVYGENGNGGKSMIKKARYDKEDCLKKLSKWVVM